MLPGEVEWWHWVFGILTACLILPVWANWISKGKIRLVQKGIFEPFMLGLLGGLGGSIGSVVRGEWGASGIGLCLATGVALLVIIVKSIRGTFITKEDVKED
jgi:hypothetical protein